MGTSGQSCFTTDKITNNTPSQHEHICKHTCIKTCIKPNVEKSRWMSSILELFQLQMSERPFQPPFQSSVNLLKEDPDILQQNRARCESFESVICSSTKMPRELCPIVTKFQPSVENWEMILNCRTNTHGFTHIISPHRYVFPTNHNRRGMMTFEYDKVESKNLNNLSVDYSVEQDNEYNSKLNPVRYWSFERENIVNLEQSSRKYDFNSRHVVNFTHPFIIPRIYRPYDWYDQSPLTSLRYITIKYSYLCAGKMRHLVGDIYPLSDNNIGMRDLWHPIIGFHKSSCTFQLDLFVENPVIVNSFDHNHNEEKVLLGFALIGTTKTDILSFPENFATKVEKTYDIEYLKKEYTKGYKQLHEIKQVKWFIKE